MTNYKKYDEKTWADFGKSLLSEKGSEKQKEFLEICRSPENFLHYIDDHLLSGSIVGESIFKFTHKFSESEFINPPLDTQQIIWDEFHSIPTNEIKFSCGFWGFTIVNMIRDNRIKPEYLAADSNGISRTGRHIVEEAIKFDDDKKIDDCVRRILRSMCNPAPRGKRIVFNDFYLGKSYWRWAWAEKMTGFVDLEFGQILEILTDRYYADFSGKMHSGKSYVSQGKILGGLILYLRSAKKETISGQYLRKIIDRISYLSLWKALEAQSPQLNQKEIESIANG